MKQTMRFKVMLNTTDKSFVVASNYEEQSSFVNFFDRWGNTVASFNKLNVVSIVKDE